MQFNLAAGFINVDLKNIQVLAEQKNSFKILCYMGKKTVLERDISMKFLNENPQLGVGDIVYEDDFSLIAIDIKECDAIVIRPASMYEMAAVCYEIGNKHLPLFYQDEEIVVAYEVPLFALLTAGGYNIEQAKRKLIQPLKTTVTPHGSSSNSLFNRIMKLTTDPE